MTLLSMVNSWEFSGQALIRASKKNKFKKREKMFLAVRRKNKKNKSCVLASKSSIKSSTFSLKKQISFLIKRWERNYKKPVSNKKLNKSCNYWKKLYRLTRFLNSTSLLTKWLTHANTSAKNKNMLFCRKS